MARNGINIRIELDHKTDALLREWVKAADEKSKRHFVRKLVRRRVKAWAEKRAQGAYQD
jgi:Arc/MetJ family transcription regulator